MKNILFITESLNVGGMERVQVDIANALCKIGYNITIILYEKSANENFENQLLPNIELKKVSKRTFPILSKLPRISKYFKHERWQERVSARRLYREYVGYGKTYDVEIAFYRGPAVKIISGSPNKKSKKIAWVHNDYRLVNEKTITRFFKNIDEAIVAHNAFDKIIAVSEEAKQSFIDKIGYPEKCMTIYNMISCENIRKMSTESCPVEKKRFTIISVGRLINAKGYELLLKIIKRLNRDGLDFDFWLVGYGPLEEKLKEYVNNNNLQNVSLLGKQMNPYKYMKQADVYVCSSWREGFSLVVAEAMACNVPVVSTRCTGPVEILKDGEFGILMDYDEENIYDTLKKIIISPNILEKYRKAAWKRSTDFDEKKIVKELVNLLES